MMALFILNVLNFPMLIEEGYGMFGSLFLFYDSELNGADLRGGINK